MPIFDGVFGTGRIGKRRIPEDVVKSGKNGSLPLKRKTPIPVMQISIQAAE